MATLSVPALPTPNSDGMSRLMPRALTIDAAALGAAHQTICRPAAEQRADQRGEID